MPHPMAPVLDDCDVPRTDVSDACGSDVSAPIVEVYYDCTRLPTVAYPKP